MLPHCSALAQVEAKWIVTSAEHSDTANIGYRPIFAVSEFRYRVPIFLRYRKSESACANAVSEGPSMTSRSRERSPDRDVIEGPSLSAFLGTEADARSGDSQGPSEGPWEPSRIPSDICVPLTCIGIGYRDRRYPIFFGYRPIPSDTDTFEYRKVVEDYTARWQVPLPQLQVLQTALCCFTSASVSFPPECEHVQDVLSRLALSLFELLLFFGKDEFYEAPLKDILGSVQECHDLLIHYDSVDLRLVTCVIKDGGPWEDPVLQAILKGKSEPQDIVDRYLRSENQLFFEFRVRYLIACERISEAVALITTCLSHPDVSKNLYYHQAYFTCLHMTRLTDKLLPEHVLRIDCSDGVKIICNIEKEGKTALALQLSEAFLITQLQTGKMYCLWDLIFIWSKLQLKVNPSKQVFVEQCYNMLRIATNVKAIFPFMKTIREEVSVSGGRYLFGQALDDILDKATDKKKALPEQRNPKKRFFRPSKEQPFQREFKGKGKTGRWSYPKGGKGRNILVPQSQQTPDKQ
ncbi:unnamed protein product [Ranitomeya imitator]|uniref:Zinc finger protein Rlf/292/654 TPR repeats domain-containing protein n=1 Tax=Ranitomeya imitator TaxID=111125 RepID=A0ABN9LCA9_9NEOB|nr:unnamed protein product [Ranitomeya imitator]